MSGLIDIHTHWCLFGRETHAASYMVADMKKIDHQPATLDALSNTRHPVNALEHDIQNRIHLKIVFAYHILLVLLLYLELANKHKAGELFFKFS